MLISCAKATNQLSQEIFSAVFQQLITVISQEPDASYLASLYKCFHDTSLLISPSRIPPTFIDALFKATSSQLHAIAQKRKNRQGMSERQLEEEREDLALTEEMEDFALEDMGKVIRLFGENGGGVGGDNGQAQANAQAHAQQLMIALGSVKELAVINGAVDWESEQ
jgi:hypothetical protein